jgi:hypothetical protein
LEVHQHAPPRPRLAAALLALAAAAVGCPGSSGHGPVATTPTGAGVGGACSRRSDCASDLVCYLSSCATALPASSACVPPGTPILADGGTLGDADPGTCVSTVRAPVQELVDAGLVQDLGTLQVGQRGTFEVPAGSAGFLLMSQEVASSAHDSFTWQGFALPNVVVPTDVRDPSGALVWDDLSDASFPPDPSGLFAYALGFDPIAGTFEVPNTSVAVDRLRTAGHLAEGTWSFTANDWATECLSISGCTGGSRSGVYQYFAVTKPGPAASTGTLDVEVYLATDPAGAVTALRSAALAAASTDVARFVKTLGAYLGNAGLCLGTVTFHDLPAWARSRYAANGSVDISDGGPCGSLAQLFTTATVQRPSVHLFLAEELKQGSGGNVVGVDGAIPGPSGFPGTITGGAVVGVFDEIGRGGSTAACEGAPNLSGCGSDLVAYIAAHEIGHWLGLFHPTESGGDQFDPISDTATCSCASCAPQNARSGCGSSTLMLNQYCLAGGSCGGGANLMFWNVSLASSRGELSIDQGQVARQNPVVR